MKKAIIFAAAVVGISLALTACACKHEYEEKITAEAACTQVGVRTFTCTKCKDSYTQEIPAAGHVFGETVVTKEASCYEEGEMAAVCTVCGEKDAIEKLPVSVHSYRQLENTVPTCTEQGMNTWDCSVCHDTKVEYVQALGHDYRETTVITEESCTANGKIRITCSRCGDQYTETVNAAGHKWVEADCTEAKHCRTCGLEEGEALGHEYSNGTPSACIRCGEKKMTLTHDTQASKSTLTYYTKESGMAISRAEVLKVSYDTGLNGFSLTVNIKIKRTYDGYHESDPSPVGFSFTIYDSDGNVARQASPTFSKIRVGQEYTISYLYQLEPDAYTIVLGDKIG